MEVWVGGYIEVICRQVFTHQVFANTVTFIPLILTEDELVVVVVVDILGNTVLLVEDKKPTVFP